MEIVATAVTWVATAIVAITILAFFVRLDDVEHRQPSKEQLIWGGAVAGALMWLTRGNELAVMASPLIAGMLVYAVARATK